jgi:hypothetical protein
MLYEEDEDMVVKLSGDVSVTFKSKAEGSSKIMGVARLGLLKFVTCSQNELKVRRSSHHDLVIPAGACAMITE